MFWDDERSLGNSLIVTLAGGWAFNGAGGPDPEHVKGFDRVADAMTAVRRAAACTCERCRAAIAKVESPSHD
jgi:hypothetical protein